VASNHTILSGGHSSFVPCYGSVLLSLFWADTLQLLSAPCYSGPSYQSYVQMLLGIQLSAQNVKFIYIEF
jgi:hypothetical protein